MFKGKQDIFHNNNVLPVWREGWSMKEQAMRARATKSIENLSQHSKNLPPLSVGDTVFIQNQTGNHPNKWDRTGTIMNCRPHHQYIVKVDATGRITLRNRQFLRKYTPPAKNVLLGIPPSMSTSRENEPIPQSEEEKNDTQENISDRSSNIVQENTNQILDTHTGYPDPAVENNPIIPAIPPDIEHIPELRRSTRMKKPTRIYDPSDGRYILPQG